MPAPLHNLLPMLSVFRPIALGAMAALTFSPKQWAHHYIHIQWSYHNLLMPRVSTTCQPRPLKICPFEVNFWTFSLGDHVPGLTHVTLSYIWPTNFFLSCYGPGIILKVICIIVVLSVSYILYQIEARKLPGHVKQYPTQ